MASLGEIIRGLMGGRAASAAMPVQTAPPLENYPTRADAEYAQDYGFGGMNAPYVQGETARVIGQRGRQGFDPMMFVGRMTKGDVSQLNKDELSQNLDLRAPANAPMKDKLGTTLAQAALAANRMPVAHLGFDPTYMTFDTVNDNPTYAGAMTEDPRDPTNRSADTIYSTLSDRDPSTPVHEAMHRGMMTLKGDPALKDIFARLPDEESIVRYLMATQGGNPELGTSGGDKQIARAMELFKGNKHKKDLDALDFAAQEAWAKRRPGGPR